MIERSRALPGLVHVAAIRSTGLSASLAIGEHVAAMLAEDGAIVASAPQRPLARAEREAQRPAAGGSAPIRRSQAASTARVPAP